MPTPRFAVVDSLRGLAALWVLFYHLWMRFYPGLTPRYRPPEFPPDPALVPIGYGYTGVILFFVVSGFCIHFPQAKRFVATGSDQLSLADFTRRRFWRLYPAYFASIVVAVVMARLIPAILLALRGKPFDAAEAFSVGDALANALFLQPLFPESLQLNPVYWTLIYEIQFYAAYPALLWLVRRFGFCLVGVGLLACELAAIAHPLESPLMERFFLNRYFEWYVGMVVAERVAQGRHSQSWSVASVGLAGGLIASFIPVVWPYHNLILSIGFAGLLAALIMRPWGWLCSTPLVWIGTISYSLYLMNTLTIDATWVYCHLFAKYGIISESVADGLSFLSIPGAIALGYGLFRLAEKPFLPSESRLRTRELVAPVAAVASSPATN